MTTTISTGEPAPAPAPAAAAAGQPRPAFLGNPALDALTEVCLELSAELWLVRTRLDRLEQVLSDEGRDVSALVEAYRPAADRQRAAQQERDRLIRRVLGPLTRLGEPAGGESDGR